MTTLITNNQFKQFDLNGEPLASGKIYTYDPGSTTPRVTYQDEAMSTAHTNPIILDSFGEATIWIDGDTKLIVTDSDDVTIRTYDSFSDTTSGDTPAVSSPLGAIYRSTSTDTGYIKIRLPMNSWPNTKMTMDILIYEDNEDESFKISASGYASSVSSAWENATAKTTGLSNIDVQFGNDGTYPAIYIGAVDSEWSLPQIAVVNFLAGEYSYNSATWSSGWEITVTTSIGTITQTKTAEQAAIGWDAWQAPSYENGWAAYTSVDLAGLQYRRSKDGLSIQLVGSIIETGTVDSTVFTLPSGYRPPNRIYDIAVNSTFSDSRALLLEADGNVAVASYAAGVPYTINAIITLD